MPHLRFLKPIVSMKVEGATMRKPIQSDWQVITRIIIPVVAFALGSIAFAMVGLFSVTYQGDRLSMDREIRATQVAIDESIEELAREQEMVSINDETAAMLDAAQPDWAWFDRNFADRLHRSYQHDQLFILNARDEPVYAAIDGTRVAAHRFDDLDSEVRRMLAVVRGRIREPNHRHDRNPGQPRSGASTILTSDKAVHESHLVSIGGEPAAASVMLIAPLSQSTAPSLVAGPVAISIRFLDPDFFEALSKTALIENPRFSRAGDVGPDERAIILKTEHGEAIGNFIWTPERTGSRIFDVLAPVTAAVLLTMLALLAWLARSLHRAFSKLRSEVVVREQAEFRAEALARHDSLTGLPNRRVFVEELDRLCAAQADDEPCPGALILLDVESMRDLNDTLGFAVADELLVQIAGRLRAFDHKGAAARIGGDEFSLFLAGDSETGDLRSIVAQAQESLNQPYAIGNVLVPATISAGVALFPKDGETPSDLISAADAALRRGKRTAPAQATFYDAEEDVSGRLGSTVRPLHAQDSDRPQFQIAELTDTVVRSACRAAAEWPAETSLCLSVPIAPLTDPWFAARLLAVMNGTGLAPGRLIVEVPGPAMVASFRVCSDNLAELQAAGVRISVADPGGALNPARWRTLRLDQIRIDRLDQALSAPSGLAKARTA
jgi:diguanylate cyclase (GGDEF)-like protein